MSAGRPKGSRNYSAQFLHYNPKRWQPEFDLIVIESVAGKSNAELARLFGYTKEHISNILSTPQAAEVKERIRSTINKEFEGGIKDRLAKIGEKTIKHIEKFVEDEDGYSNKRPFDFVDRMLKIAQAVGSVGDKDATSRSNTTIVNGNALIVNQDQASGLRDALSKSMELDQVQPSKLLPEASIKIA